MLGALRKESQRVTSRASMISATGTPLMTASFIRADGIEKTAAVVQEREFAEPEAWGRNRASGAKRKTDSGPRWGWDRLGYARFGNRVSPGPNGEVVSLFARVSVDCRMPWFQ